MNNRQQIVNLVFKVKGQGHGSRRVPFNIPFKLQYLANCWWKEMACGMWTHNQPLEIKCDLNLQSQ